MNPTTVPGISIAACDAFPDVTLCVIWSPCQPLGLVTVLVEPDPGADHVALLRLLDDAIERLTIYRADYAAARAADQDDPAEHTCTPSASGWCLICGLGPRAGDSL